MIKIKFFIGAGGIVNTWAEVVRLQDRKYALYFPDGSFDLCCRINTRRMFFGDC
jgi:hypothetical protein